MSTCGCFPKLETTVVALLAASAVAFGCAKPAPTPAFAVPVQVEKDRDGDGGSM